MNVTYKILYSSIAETIIITRQMQKKNQFAIYKSLRKTFITENREFKTE
jgi:hypothetical protein